MHTGRRAHLSVVATDDDALVAGVRAGDAACATAFVKRVGPRAKACVRRLLRGDASDHEDIVQLALVELVTTIDRFSGQCSLDTWVDRLTAHLVYKKLRRSRLERRLFDGLLDDAETQAVASTTSSERRAMTVSVLNRIRSRLQHLDEEKVASWVLFDVHGLSLEEVAGVLEISVTAAQSRVSRARRDVHAALAGDDELAQLLPMVEAS
jgi:RNA polymerase sigma-70 factor, ECF subfamily